MNITANTTPLADRLRSETAPLHFAAERHPAMRGLMKGELPLAALVQQTGQMMLVHRELERLLKLHAAQPAIAAVYRPWHDRSSLYEADVAALGGVASSVAPSPATQRLFEAMRAAEPAVLLGFLYVLEGSTNGAKFIGPAMARAYGLTGGRGLSALDPHGDQQSVRWQSCRAALNSLELTVREADLVVAAADAQFRHAIELMHELVAEHTVSGTL